MNGFWNFFAETLLLRAIARNLVSFRVLQKPSKIRFNFNLIRSCSNYYAIVRLVRSVWTKRNNYCRWSEAPLGTAFPILEQTVESHRVCDALISTNRAYAVAKAIDMWSWGDAVWYALFLVEVSTRFVPFHKRNACWGYSSIVFEYESDRLGDNLSSFLLCSPCKFEDVHGIDPSFIWAWNRFVSMLSMCYRVYYNL